MKVAAALALILVPLFVTAWLVMLLVGMWHGIRPAVPPIGFSEALVATVIAQTLTGALSGSRDAS